MQSTQPPVGTSEPAVPQPLWRELRDTIRGHQCGLTPGSRCAARCSLLAVPMVLELVLESTFAVVDISSWLLGPSAVATVGLTDHLFLLVFWRRWGWRWR